MEGLVLLSGARNGGIGDQRSSAMSWPQGSAFRAAHVLPREPAWADAPNSPPVCYAHRKCGTLGCTYQLNHLGDHSNDAVSNKRSRDSDRPYRLCFKLRIGPRIFFADLSYQNL